ncbi:hypothetical protein [Rubripirellula reticaptiva]|uniref:Uncharacterized protein n=1 Tax=Rubripirellula reticaptiva TaxID=2528013 RepID=A0A5C6EVC2_9BACT|nr:hypothetical protein [Rubripirellula reticaptiva]TWU51419.1 hypothetical protein Poly59_30110 [Rubripirellula reticaptiva]
MESRLSRPADHQRSPTELVTDRFADDSIDGNRVSLSLTVARSMVGTIIAVDNADDSLAQKCAVDAHDNGRRPECCQLDTRHNIAALRRYVIPFR